ncbi:MAG: hypothetical protein UR39_C0003G0005 [Candidatus Woesebacteria bacterium GW2011_GWA1_33_30]|uniref:DUF1648 domain-containing protein n=1 Tax=Candidatus Woesebacteria bacterium GW2011_GWA2_33_28 TaxID=1618561 RepID=A0A0G0C8W3_9BACT|nr:MAG: hypothetical protein UR38_C0003G0005 [Candidatus Woesebacteria bacterium GW2011_GWA2_33_28]KKP48470.1 MAG: hypothetical protein UR39_C0003G0005 [Candidatus Woesebacteria bacterium GW2011_GWA1_33_30]KKP49606.1 MAG: hypothetical protein UR40_C0004G0005 [Microgenomates group bacterium GW2011_GWC1_33_32]KKP52223.1 MAG: hypothetical protein UR44_C0003G0005 [Candidatus Woesebacteria bacterium GW2011_GWB1_33_38]KKP55877.1 MAG: hypothetical protein UR48_C0047G0004 [Microgenomates group bacteriu
MALHKQIIDPRFERLPLFKLIVAIVITNLSVILIGLLARIILPPEIPIFFGLPQTEEQLAPALFITIPPTISLIFVLINSTMAIHIESFYIKKSLAFGSLAITLLSTIAAFKIIFLVGSI